MSPIQKPPPQAKHPGLLAQAVCTVEKGSDLSLVVALILFASWATDLPFPNMVSSSVKQRDKVLPTPKVVVGLKERIFVMWPALACV